MASPRFTWLYTPTPISDYATTGQPPADASYTEFTFLASNKKLAQVFGQISHGTTTSLGSTRGSAAFGNRQNSLALSDSDITGLLKKNTTPEQIEIRFGKPNAIFESPVTRWLNYSRSPGSTDYRVRRIGLDATGTVVDKESELYWD